MSNHHDLESPNEDVRLAALQRLGSSKSWRVYRLLLAVAMNQEKTELARIYALKALSYPSPLGKIARALRTLIFDETESLNIRSQAIEWCSAVLRTDKGLTLFSKLLDHPAPDMRFWAVFALTNRALTWGTIAPIFNQLERIAAFDSAVPALWGWHVHREALAALERLYFRRYFGRRIPLRNTVSTRLISPAPEYARYQAYLREGSDLPDMTAFTLEKSWLEVELHRAWTEITFQVRPHSQTYQLSWIVKINGQHLLGGLHRDGYAVVVTGEDAARNRFICWYRESIAKYDVFVYEWAMGGIVLSKGMTPEQLASAEDALYAQ